MQFSRALRVAAREPSAEWCGSGSSDYPGLYPGLFSVVPHKTRHSFMSLHLDGVILGRPERRSGHSAGRAVAGYVASVPDFPFYSEKVGAQSSSISKKTVTFVMRRRRDSLLDSRFRGNYVRILADTDLLVFLYTLGRILFVSPFHLALNSRQRAVPKTLQFEEVLPGSLSDEQEKYFQSYDRKFAELNYQPTATYQTTNFGQTLTRSYVNPLEPVRAVVMVVEVMVNVNGVVSSAHSCTTQFITRFTDGTVLVTRNTQRKPLFDNPPFRILQECPQVSNPAELRRRHLSKLESLGRTPISALCDFGSIVKEIQEQHERLLAFQLQRGAYSLNPVTGRFETTAKIHWRGIRNHLNPLLHLQRFPRWRLAMAALFGISLPVLASLRVAPDAARRAQDLGLPGSLASGLIMLSAYAFAGTVIGYFVRSSTFIWSFIFTYLAVGCILGFQVYPIPYSTFAACIAHVVARSVKRRRLILKRTAPPLTVETQRRLALRNSP